MRLLGTIGPSENSRARKDSLESWELRESGGEGGYGTGLRGDLTGVSDVVDCELFISRVALLNLPPRS